MNNFTELFKVKYSGGLIKAQDSGELHTEVKEIQEIDGVSDVTAPSVDNVSTGHFHIDITYDSELTDRTRIANQIEAMEMFENVIFG